MARETWLSRIGEKVKLSHLSSISAKVLDWPLATGLTARFFLMGKAMSLTVMGVSKVAAGGDMLADYFKDNRSLRAVKLVPRGRSRKA